MKLEPKRLQDVVYAVLVDNLASGKLRPGMRLRESELARQFTLSRVPIRAALKRLESEGLLEFNGRRGYRVLGEGTEACDEEAPVLAIPSIARDGLESRNWRQRLFEEAQTAIASAMVFGSFGVNEKAMAEHYGVSRSVAHEIITRMERVGLVRQQANGRWQVGPMTEQDVQDHYTMRRLLEPVALVEAVDLLPREAVAHQIAELRRMRGAVSEVGVPELLLIEQWLHRDIVLSCRNRILADSIERSQLPLISTHISFTATRSEASVYSTIDQHLLVLEALQGGFVREAAAALERHLEEACDVAVGRVKNLTPGDLPVGLPFLTELD